MTEDDSIDPAVKSVAVSRARIILLIVLTAVTLLRIHFMGVPLERDEGEYAYSAQLILDGVPPFVQTYNMKMPGIYGFYALIMAVFGQTYTGIRLGFAAVNAATAAMLFAAFRRRFDLTPALLGAAGFAVISMAASVHGFMANAEHAVLFFASAGFLALPTGPRDGSVGRTVLSGLAFGLAFMMKQHGIAFVVFGGFILMVVSGSDSWKRRVGRLALYSLAAATPFLITCLFMALIGVFDRFWFWTFTYGKAYAGMTPLSIGLLALALQSWRIATEMPLVLLMAIIGAAAVGFEAKKRPQAAWFFFGLAVFSFLAVCPGFYFREHYFLFLLPTFALGSGLGLDFLVRRVLKGRGPTAIVVALAAVLVFGFHIFSQTDLYFRMSSDQVSRAVYSLNPFPESLRIGAWIERGTDPDDTVAVLGSEPQIYFYSKRRAATGFMYIYALMEKHPFARRMQEDMIREIEAANPRVLIVVTHPASWLAREGSGTYIFDWSRRFIDEHYHLVGIIDMSPDAETRYVWGKEALTYQPRSPYWVGAYMRRP